MQALYFTVLGVRALEMKCTMKGSYFSLNWFIGKEQETDYIA